MNPPWLLLMIFVSCQATRTPSSSTTVTPTDTTHHHHYYQHNSSRSHTIPITIRETTYRPKVGEIHVKDSILYSQKPADVRHLRRQLWPIMENTMDTIAKGVATGAKILQHMMRPNLLVTGDPKYVRRVPTKTLHIKNVYMPQALTASALHKRQVKPPPPPTPPPPTKAPFKMPKPSTIVVDEKPVNTISEDYVLRYSGHDPTYVIRKKTNKANPFAEMGVTGYRHFEATVLRELEEKEERKVESSMFQKPDEEALDWKPMMSISSTMKPAEMSALNTNTSGQDIKPVHEDVQETKGFVVTAAESPTMSRYKARKPHKPTVVATVSPTSSTTEKTPAPTTEHTVLDVPNYPDFFIQQNRHLTPLRSTKPTMHMATTTTTVRPTVRANVPKSDDLNSALDFGRYRQHFQHIGGASTQQRGAIADMDSSQSKPSAVAVVMSSSAPTRATRANNRHTVKPKATVETMVSIDAESTAEAKRAASMGRGKVKFGDRVESS